MDPPLVRTWRAAVDVNDRDQPACAKVENAGSSAGGEFLNYRVSFIRISASSRNRFMQRIFLLSATEFPKVIHEFIHRKSASAENRADALPVGRVDGA